MAKRWTIPFVSQANKQCRIDIYDPGYTGSVTELSTNNADAPGVPAADPFYFEEDDDDDLLEVVRTKTGYINLIETVQDGLADIYPTTLRNRYVEVYYDGDNQSDMVFRGYIQMQTFENDWQAVPREISLPLISVLGMAQYGEFDQYLSFTDVKLGYYMKKIIDFVQQPSGNGYGYSDVVFPDNSFDFSATIRPTVVTIDNPDFSQALTLFQTKQPYKGISFYDFLEGICNAYGWICHDLPDRILFTKFDHNGKYYKYAISDLATAANKTDTGITGADIETLSNMNLCSDDSTISNIPSARTVTKKFDGEAITKVNMDFSHEYCSHLYTYKHNDQEEFMAILRRVGSYPDITGTYVRDDNALAVPNFYLNDNGITIIDFNGTKSVVLQGLSSFASSGVELFSLNFYKRPINNNSGRTDNKLKFKFKCKWGNTLNALGTDGLILYAFKFNAKFYCGNQLLYTESNIEINEGHSDIEIVLKDQSDNAIHVPVNNAIRVVFEYVSSSSSDSPAAFEFVMQNLSLEYQESAARAYLLDETDKILVGDTYGGSENQEVNMLMSAECLNSNLIGGIITTGFTNYQYLRHPQTRLQVKMRGYGSPLWYMKKIQFWQTNWRWRLIALSFHPWDDEWMLTMHRSSTIEQ
jgi:hypothetical protein